MKYLLQPLISLDLRECPTSILVWRMVTTPAVPTPPCGRLASVFQHGVLPVERHQVGAAAGRRLVLLPAVSLLSTHGGALSAAGGSVNRAHSRSVLQHDVCCWFLRYDLFCCSLN